MIPQSNLKRIAWSAGLFFFVLLLIQHTSTISYLRYRIERPDKPHGSRVDGEGSYVPGSRTAYSHALPGVTGWEKPTNISKVMGLVFYGRRHTVSILDCYLKRNLAKNGGVLDGVIFVVRTSDAADLALLDKMVASEPDYTRQQVNLSTEGYASSYDYIDDDVLYIKMDDDIVFIEDTAMKAVAAAKASRPDWFIVSGNVINQIRFSWLHRNFGAIKPYLPEVTESSTSDGNLTDWRTSSLPSWAGPSDFQYEAWSEKQHAHARWLPVREASVQYALSNTPISRLDYANGYSHGHWQVAAQEHYSFLENLEKNELWRYRFPSWDFQFERMGIQFVAIIGRDINLAKPIIPDDEHYFTVEMPKRLGRHAAADGTGVVAHFAYGPQSREPGVHSTDVLDRYRIFAQENICKGPMLWSPEDEAQAH